jgi:hypothetical protein
MTIKWQPTIKKALEQLQEIEKRNENNTHRDGTDLSQ